MSKERLVELILQTETYSPEQEEYARKWAEYKAIYLLRNGVIVPPCKVGDVVYVITSDCSTGIEKTRVSQIKVEVKENGKISYRISAPCVYDDWGKAHWTFCEFDFGKTVFLSREEAEAKLKEVSE